MSAFQKKYLIIGLGNPGERYTNNRHNIGFMVISNYLTSAKIKMVDMRYGRGAETDDAIFLMPNTYMNHSGEAVKYYISKKMNNDTSRVCVIQDDMDIEIGRVLLKFNGGDNGHNGIRSINNLTGTNQYYRLRIGVGRPPEGVDPADYLLSDFLLEEWEIIKDSIKKAMEGINIILKDGFVKAMNKINRTKTQSKKEERIND